MGLYVGSLADFINESWVTKAQRKQDQLFFIAEHKGRTEENYRIPKAKIVMLKKHFKPTFAGKADKNLQVISYS